MDEVTWGHFAATVQGMKRKPDRGTLHFRSRPRRREPENEPCTDYRKFEFLINKKYKDYPNLINALMTRFDRYNEQCKRMKQLEEDGILMVLRPSHKYVKSFEMNTDVLDEAYNAGKNLAKEKLAEIEDFLNVLEKK